MEEESIDALLTSAAGTFPPEILRIIASKYRRAYEIKPCLCPEAITLEPIVIEQIQDLCTEYRYVFPEEYTYIFIKGNKNAPLWNDMKIGKGNYPLVWNYEEYSNFREMDIHYNVMNDTVECYKIENFPIIHLLRGLILLKRHQFDITGDTFIKIYHITKTDDVKDTRFLSIRQLLYEETDSWDPKILPKNDSNDWCSIM